MILCDPKSREEWLECRKNGIGGSDAGSVAGRNFYKSNLDIFSEKTGKTVPVDISENSAVKFGKNAEKHVRALFSLNYPEFQVDYHEFRMYANKKYPFIYATLDGELTDCSGKHGILEIKTTTIQHSAQWSDWDGKIPDSYYIQLLHQLLATGWDYAILYAYIRYFHEDEMRTTMRRYDVERADVVQDIAVLLEIERDFWEHVQKNIPPALILPEI